MKDKRKHILKEAVVLMIAATMVFSIIPTVSADDEPIGIPQSWREANEINPSITLPEQVEYITPQFNVKTPDMGGVGSTVIYDNGLSYSQLGASQDDPISGLDPVVADDFVLPFTATIEDFHWIGGYWNPYEDGYFDWRITFYNDNGGKPGTTIYTELFPEASLVKIPTATTAWFEYHATITAPFVLSGGTTYWVSAQGVGAFAPQSGFGMHSPTTAGSDGLLKSNYFGYPDWTALWPGYDCAFQITGTEGGGGGGECLEDQCDFELVSINNIQPGPINSLPQVINITVRNNGEVGINEVKILAEIYEKVCGPTSTLCCDPVYDLCEWETQADADWDWIDDGDGDTFVLQGGPDNRWLTHDQAWRCTKGEDRSYGGDDDTYLGLSPTASGYDELIWHCDPNDITGAACAVFTFSQWCEGEYGFIDGNINPVDYGTLAYSLDNGTTFTELDIADFVAYDTEDAWEDVTIRFINTAVYNDTSYADVCEDCDVQDGDIAIYEEFPATDAKLWIKWIWHKDPCDQYEGWYIDNVCLERTEMYDLVLVWQGWVIMPLPPCIEEPQNIYVEFPLSFDPIPDTWYYINICGQVFDDNMCELIFDNNCIDFQFLVTDIHDMICTGINLLTPGPFGDGDTACVNMTVKNAGTFAENNVPVELKVGKCILDKAIYNDMESDYSDNWDDGIFTGGDGNSYFELTNGRTDVDNLDGTRSILPGNEALICAAEGFVYPYLPEGCACGIFSKDTFDLSGAKMATLSFYAKWSIPWGDENGDGYVDHLAGLLVHPTTGPDSSYWWFIRDGLVNYLADWSNDWTFFSLDMMDIVEGFAYDGTIPDVEIAFGVVTDPTPDGIVRNPANPIPWDGMILDNIALEIVSCTDMVVVDTQYTGALAPGDTETLTLCWNDMTYCNWCVCGDIQLPGDIDPSNDICCLDECLAVRETIDLTNWLSMDLTGEGDCLWHICCTRSCDGTCCAWAGIEEENHAHYVDNMDDSMISPVMNLSSCINGAVVEFTTWFEFADSGDFGEVYARGSSSDSWVRLTGTLDAWAHTVNRITGSSGGMFIQPGDCSFYIPAAQCTDTAQIKFRMVSDSAGNSEGWYICSVEVICALSAFSEELCDLQLPEADTNNAYGPFSDHGTYICFDEVNTCGNDVTTLEFWGMNVYGDGIMVGKTLDIGFYQDDGTGWVNPLAPCAGSPIDITITSADLVEIFVPDWLGYPIWHVKKTLTTPLQAPTGLGPFYFKMCGYDYPSEAFVWYDDGAGTGNGQHYKYYEPYGYLYRYTYYEPSWGLSSLVPPVTGTEVKFTDDFDRDFISPWICERTSAGDYWNTTSQCITDYPSNGPGLNDVMYKQIDLTDPELTYAEFYFTTEWDMEAGTHAYIEFSTTWDGASPMDSAVWVPYWDHAGGDSQALISSQDLVPDDRFVINEFLGQKVYVRFRYTTPGEGFPENGGFWCIHDKQLLIKKEVITFTDTEPPVTNIYFDCLTAKVTLVAIDYPLEKNSGVKATYYKIDSGDFIVYTAPFTIPEGTHTVYYYSEDNAGNVENQKSKTYTVDTTPPTVEITSPEVGKLYLFGSPIMNRIFNKDVTLCIGKVPVAATADDAGGSGVNKVLFEFDGTTAWDDSAPYEAVFSGMHFGDLTISAVALDNTGLESAPDTMTVKVYCLGLF